MYDIRGYFHIQKAYTHVRSLPPEIKEMMESGKSHQEIEEFFGLSGDHPMHNPVKRERRKENRIAAGIPPRLKGRPWKAAVPRDITAEQAHGIRQLKMENKLRVTMYRVTSPPKYIRLRLICGRICQAVSWKGARIDPAKGSRGSNDFGHCEP